MAETVSELVDNFVQHSEESLAALHMQYYPNRGEVVVAVGDCGVGIRHSLAESPVYAYLRARPDHEAAFRAFGPMVSRKREGGTGLYDVKNAILELEGSVRLATGAGYVEFTPKSHRYGPKVHELPGVQIELRVPAGGLPW